MGITSRTLVACRSGVLRRGYRPDPCDGITPPPCPSAPKPLAMKGDDLVGFRPRLGISCVSRTEAAVEGLAGWCPRRDPAARRADASPPTPLAAEGDDWDGFRPRPRLGISISCVPRTEAAVDGLAGWRPRRDPAARPTDAERVLLGVRGSRAMVDRGCGAGSRVTGDRRLIQLIAEKVGGAGKKIFCYVPSNASREMG